MKDLQILKFNGQKIGSVLYNGMPYFVGRDIALALEFSDPYKAIEDHVDIESMMPGELYTLADKDQLVLIDEAGVFDLAYSSTSPVAKEFRQWLVSEGIPLTINPKQKRTFTHGIIHLTNLANELFETSFRPWQLLLLLVAAVTVATLVGLYMNHLGTPNVQPTLVRKEQTNE